MAIAIGGGSGNAISINGSVGSAGQVIVSDGTNASWSSGGSAVVSGSADTSLVGVAGVTLTGLPSWIRIITFQYKNMRVNSNGALIGVRIGVGGVIQTTGYSSVGGVTVYSNGLAINNNNNSTTFTSGQGMLTRMGTTNTWAWWSIAGATGGNASIMGNGYVDATGTLDSVRVFTSVGGFDTGSFSINSY